MRSGARAGRIEEVARELRDFRLLARPGGPAMKARRLTAQQFAPLIRSFYDAHGPEQMKASYEWDSPGTRMYPGERVWAFDDVNWLSSPPTSDVVGWGSMHFNTRDAEQGDAVLIVGVFPQFQ